MPRCKPVPPSKSPGCAPPGSRRSRAGSGDELVGELRSSVRRTSPRSPALRSDRRTRSDESCTTPATSPYVRKVIACAHGLAARSSQITTDRHQPACSRRPTCWRTNPLSKVPCLVTQDGLALFDSPRHLRVPGRGRRRIAVPTARPGTLARAEAAGDRRRHDGRRRAAPHGDGAARDEDARVDASMDPAESETIDRARSICCRRSHSGPTTSTSARSALHARFGYLDLRFASDDAWRDGRGTLAHLV